MGTGRVCARGRALRAEQEKGPVWLRIIWPPPPERTPTRPPSPSTQHCAFGIAHPAFSTPHPASTHQENGPLLPRLALPPLDTSLTAPPSPCPVAMSSFQLPPQLQNLKNINVPPQVKAAQAKVEYYVAQFDKQVRFADSASTRALLPPLPSPCPDHREACQELSC